MGVSSPLWRHANWSRSLWSIEGAAWPGGWDEWLEPLSPHPASASTGQAAPQADSNHMLEEKLCALLLGPGGLAFLDLSQPIFPA